MTTKQLLDQIASRAAALPPSPIAAFERLTPDQVRSLLSKTVPVSKFLAHLGKSFAKG